ncbi:hypothetical protein [Actinomadura sp. 7K534]|uniref:hypothetical protein n=1 Tax=Actinomadura sp. 7K534 TaxID=2530366 RepID=UPI0010520D82|nr:hypothetical protein [Actinomadura sp. 7K534]TDB96048.1 hypothetical protein E1266_11035 [Actinomadura sp. 7K534]
MTAKTGKNEADEVEAVPAEAEIEETPEADTAESPARPAAKRKRRVRVIEVIDDEDLDEVLEALDAEDEEEDEPPARSAASAKPAAKKRPTRIDPPEEEVEEDEKATPGKSAAATSTSDEGSPRPGIFGLTMVQAVVVVVLVALLASLAIWQGRSASGLSSEADEREAVRKVAAAYGDVAFNYNAQNYQTQVDKAQKLMGGDLLESYKTNTLTQLGETFQKNPEAGLSSKTDQVFVGSVDGKFANAVVMVDIGLKTKDGSTTAPATLLRLALAKIDGEWKVTKQYASGGNDQNQGQAQGQLPTAPTAGASQSPNPETSEKPGD